LVSGVRYQLIRFLLLTPEKPSEPGFVNGKALAFSWYWDSNAFALTPIHKALENLSILYYKNLI
jgi:hypothetical protein